MGRTGSGSGILFMTLAMFDSVVQGTDAKDFCVDMLTAFGTAVKLLDINGGLDGNTGFKTNEGFDTGDGGSTGSSCFKGTDIAGSTTVIGSTPGRSRG